MQIVTLTGAIAQALLQIPVIAFSSNHVEKVIMIFGVDLGWEVGIDEKPILQQHQNRRRVKVGIGLIPTGGHGPAHDAVGLVYHFSRMNRNPHVYGKT